MVTALPGVLVLQTRAAEHASLVPMHTVVLIALALVAIGSVGSAHTLAAQRSRTQLSQLAALDAVLVLLFSVAVWAPGTFEDWMREDSWIEWATVFAFLGAGYLFGRHALRSVATRGAWSRLGLAALAAFCVFVAGEEVSWGQRLLAFQPPDVFLEDNFQQELNVHNFLTEQTLFGFPLDTRFVVALIATGYGVVLPAVNAIGKGRDSVVWSVLADVSPPSSLIFAFATIAWVELAYPVKLCGEAAELMLGLAFLAVAWWRDPANQSRRWAGGVAIVLAVAVGLVAQPAVDRLFYGADEELSANTRHELEALASDLSEQDLWARKKWKKKKRIHKRMFTAIRSGYFELGDGSRFLEGQATPARVGAVDPRRDRRGYLLDPWSNPYWVHFQAKSNVILLYSFGPNRRRDTSMRSEQTVDLSSISGDDIAVEIPVGAVMPGL